MNGGEVVAAADAACPQLLDHGGAVFLAVAVGQLHDEYKPAHGAVRLNLLEAEPVLGCQTRSIPFRHAAALAEYLSDPLHLHGADGAVHIAEAIVVAKSFVREPAHAGVAALIAHGLAESGDLVVVGDDHAALAGGDLLVGIEAEDTRVAEAAGHAALVICAERFAGVLDHTQLVLSGDCADAIEVGGLSEHVDRNE